ncbi:hypothetical protein ID866_10169 [Astraeus odoratus]|nr:hypothetical protein ID866_10169 [Astraeus odoratus]
MVFIGDHKQLAPYGQESIPTLQSIFEVKHLRKTVLFLNTQYRMPSVVGNFISNHVYNGKLKTRHQDSIKLPCRFVNVERGEEEPFGHSWIVSVPGSTHLLPNACRRTPRRHGSWYISPATGNEAEHIIVSVVRSDKLGFLVNQRRTNVMLTRCKKTMVICTTRAFVSEMASSTLIGQLAATLGPQAWVSGKDIERTSRALPRRVT